MFFSFRDKEMKIKVNIQAIIIREWILVQVGKET